MRILVPMHRLHIRIYTLWEKKNISPSLSDKAPTFSFNFQIIIISVWSFKIFYVSLWIFRMNSPTRFVTISHWLYWEIWKWNLMQISQFFIINSGLCPINNTGFTNKRWNRIQNYLKWKGCGTNRLIRIEKDARKGYKMGLLFDKVKKLAKYLPSADHSQNYVLNNYDVALHFCKT